MLSSLHLKNVALVREVELSFENGLTVLTGETGAGKSILIGGISAAMGESALKDYCPDDADYVLAEAVFEPEDSFDKVADLLSSHGISAEDRQIILSRKYQNGRTINRINGETVPVSLLRETAEMLIDIHGQHEHQSLLKPQAHRQLLDRYAGDDIKDLLAECAGLYHAYRKALAQKQDAFMDEAQRMKRMDLLAYEIRELEEAAVFEGEDEQLEEAFRRMSNGQRILDALSEAEQLTSGEEGASVQISRAVRTLSMVASCDPLLSQLSDQLMELESLASDFCRSLDDYRETFLYDASEFSRVEERLNVINRLKMKYGQSVPEIQKALEDRQKEWMQLEDYEAYLQQLDRECAKALQKLQECADGIHRIRTGKAVPLQEQITEALKDLNFLDVRFEICFERLPEIHVHGADEVVFMISLNPGTPLRPLQEVASGGELSRIMLAIKSIMADEDETETLIFDEIDTGISGRTAQSVAEKMAVIADTHQVLCITHLAQIAAMADRHYVIEKQASDGKAETLVRALKENQIAGELARILGGAKITQTVMENAAEMKMQAEERKRLLRSARH